MKRRRRRQQRMLMLAGAVALLVHCADCDHFELLEEESDRRCINAQAFSTGSELVRR